MWPHLTPASEERWRALTHEALWRWLAAAPVVARPLGARIPPDLTAGAREARQAQAAGALGSLLQNTGGRLAATGQGERERAGG